MLPCKCHIKCSIYWLLIVDIQSSLLENIQNPVLYMTDQSTIHCSSTLHNNNELSKGFAFFQEWQPQWFYQPHGTKNETHLLFLWWPFFQITCLRSNTTTRRAIVAQRQQHHMRLVTGKQAYPLRGIRVYCREYMS